MASRIVRVARSLDVGNVGWTAAGLSGSLVGIGLQGKGTAVIHRADLPLLANLELLSNAALVDGPRYRALGRNAARYARGAAPSRCCCPSRRSRSARATTPASWRWWRPSARACGRSTRPSWRSRGPEPSTPSCAASPRRRGVRVTPATLERQAAAAEAAGNPQLAENLRRGAELVGVRRRRLLQLYDRLRPGRTRPPSSTAMADELEARHARRCAALVREARAAYLRRGLVT